MKGGKSGFMNILGNLSNVILPGARVPRIPGWDELKKFAMPRDSEGFWLDADDNKDYFYLKAVDANGVETCMRYRYEPDPVEEFDPNKYVTVTDFNALREEMRNGFNSIKESIAGDSRKHSGSTNSARPGSSG